MPTTLAYVVLLHCADFADGTFGAGHITNYAQNENGDVWSLQQLAQQMGAAAWQVWLSE